MSTKIYYIGHSGFYFESEPYKGFIVDPFISGNPRSSFNIPKNQIKQIFVTHGHGDHLGDSIAISKSTNAPIYTIFELSNYCLAQGASSVGLNIGGKIDFDWGWAKFLPAFHSSSAQDGQYAGMPASILFCINGTKIYHAGDNCLNFEMKLIGDIYSPDIAILPVGSFYTMDVDDAIIAAQYLKVDAVIPMHYNTFDAISVDVGAMRKKFQEAYVKLIVLNPGEELEL